MTRAEALDAILEFAGPLGPLQTPEERERRAAKWAMEASAGPIEPIIDLALNPPWAAELDGISPGDFEFELSEILTMIGISAPSLDSSSA